MRMIPTVLALPLLAACVQTPAVVAPVAAAPLPVPAGCNVDAATRLAISALPLADVIAGASTYGLSTSDVLRLFALRDGNATASDIAYAQGCFGVNV